MSEPFPLGDCEGRWQGTDSSHTGVPVVESQKKSKTHPNQLLPQSELRIENRPTLKRAVSSESALNCTARVADQAVSRDDVYSRNEVLVVIKARKTKQGTH